MRYVILMLGYIIVYRTFEVELFDTQWMLTTLAMTLVFLSGELKTKY